MEREERQISKQKHYYKRLRQGNSWEVSRDFGGYRALEQLQVDG